MDTELIKEKIKESKYVRDRVVDQINKTPTGELRNVLCDCNLILSVNIIELISELNKE